MDPGVTTIVVVTAAPFVGSFVSLLTHRLPAGEAWVLGRSRCRACGGTLAVRDLVPVLGWLANGGRCRVCAAPVSPLYPLLELAALGIAGWAAWVLPAPLLPFGCLLGWALLALAAIDARHLLLPDGLTLPLIPLGLAQASERLVEHALGAVLGYLVFAAIAAAYRRLRHREGLGLGDAKLLAAAGAWVSWSGLPSVVLIAAISGLTTAVVLRLSHRDRLAFGPHLCLGLWLVWLYGNIA